LAEAAQENAARLAREQAARAAQLAAAQQLAAQKAAEREAEDKVAAQKAAEEAETRRLAAQIEQVREQALREQVAAQKAAQERAVYEAGKTAQAEAITEAVITSPAFVQAKFEKNTAEVNKTLATIDANVSLYNSIAKANDWEKYDWNQYVGTGGRTGKEQYIADITYQKNLRSKIEDEYKAYASDVKAFLAKPKWKTYELTPAQMEAQFTAGTTFEVTYTEDGEEKKKTFKHLGDANEFIEKRQQEVMSSQGITDMTWGEFEDYVKARQKNLDKLVDQGIAKKSDDKYVLAKPPTVLTSKQIELAQSAGFDVLDTSAQGVGWLLYQYSKDKLEPGTPQYRAAVAASAVLGDFADAITAPYRVLGSIVPWETVAKMGEKQVTTSNLKYLEDVSPSEQDALYLSGVVASGLGSYVTMIPIGLTAAGINTTAKALGVSLGRITPSAVSKIATTLKANPKLTQAIIWAPIAGLEAADVYKQYMDGAPIDTIIRNEVKDISQLIGGVKGFQKGLQIYRELGPEFAKIQRLYGVKEIPGEEGRLQQLETKVEPTLKTKGLPKTVSEILIPESRPITGKETIYGIAKLPDGKQIPVIREYGDLLKTLMAGKTAGPAAIKGAILDMVTPDQYTALVKAGLNYATMSPEEIAKLMLKELGSGPGFTSPWAMTGKTEVLYADRYIAPLKPGTPQFLASKPDIGVRIKIIGAGVPVGLEETERLYKALTLAGTSPKLASELVALMTTASPLTAIEAAQKAGASDAVISLLVGGGAYVGASAQGSQLSQSLQNMGLSKSEIKIITPALIQPTTSTLQNVLPMLSTKGLTVVMSSISEETLRKLDTNTLSKVIPKLEHNTLTAVVPELDINTLTTILPKLNTDTLTTVIPKLSNDTLTSLLPKLDSATLMEIIPKLDTAQLTTVVPKLDFDTFTTAIPSLTTYQIEIILPFLKPHQKDALSERKIKPVEEDKFVVTFTDYGGRVEVLNVKASTFREAYWRAFHIRRWHGLQHIVDIFKKGKS